jgi:hypothetical protein
MASASRTVSVASGTSSLAAITWNHEACTDVASNDTIRTLRSGNCVRSTASIELAVVLVVIVAVISKALLTLMGDSPQMPEKFVLPIL